MSEPRLLLMGDGHVHKPKSRDFRVPWCPTEWTRKTADGGILDTRMGPLRARVRGLRRAAESTPGVVARSVLPMTRQPDDLKSEVGVRELRDQLSRYVQHVQGGAEVMVTMRGRRVAKLVPVDETSAFADLRARGPIREPAAPRGRRRSPLPTSAPVSDFAAAQRR